MKERHLRAAEVIGGRRPTYLLVVGGVDCTRGVESIKCSYIYQPDIKGERADQRAQSAEARGAV